MTILFVFACVMNVGEIKRDNRLSLALVHLVIDRASLFTDHRIWVAGSCLFKLGLGRDSTMPLGHPGPAGCSSTSLELATRGICGLAGCFQLYSSWRADNSPTDFNSSSLK